MTKPPGIIDIGKNVGIYTILHLLSEYLLIPLLSKAKVAGLSFHDRIELAEKLSSTVHALRIGLLSYQIIFKYKRYQGKAVTGYAEGTDELYADHMGYTLYDMWVMHKQNISQRDMWTHHLLGFLGSFAITRVRTFAFCPTIFAVTELTVPTSNALWMWARFLDKGSIFYTFLLFSRLWQYVVLRVAMVPYMLHYYAKNYREEKIEGTLLERVSGLFNELAKIPKWVLFFSLLNVTSFSILNVQWTTLMLKGFLAHFNARYNGKWLKQ